MTTKVLLQNIIEGIFSKHKKNQGSHKKEKRKEKRLSWSNNLASNEEEETNTKN